jgi:hypothetical protein
MRFSSSIPATYTSFVPECQHTYMRLNGIMKNYSGLNRIWCRMSFVNGVRDAFPESADLLYSKRALHGIREDGCPHAPDIATDGLPIPAVTMTDFNHRDLALRAKLACQGFLNDRIHHSCAGALKAVWEQAEQALFACMPHVCHMLSMRSTTCLRKPCPLFSFKNS